jgi:ribosomal protein L17
MTIQREDLMKMDWTAIAAALKDPTTQGRVIGLMKGDRELNIHIGNLLSARQQHLDTVEQDVDRQIALNSPPSTEALAAEAQQMVVAEVPVEEPAAEAVPPAVAAPVERKKIVRDYQVKDDDGNPIGRPTHLEAWSPEEMFDKMQVAHESATKAFHRLKKQKLQFKEQEKSHVMTAEEIKATALKALEAKDAVEAEKLVRGVIENDFKAKEAELARQREFENGRTIGNKFCRTHLHDYNPCEANNKALGEYLKEHGLDFTYENLEAAFIDLTEQGDKLAPVSQTEAKRPVEQAPNAPVTTAAPAVTAQAELPPAPTAAATTEAQPTVVQASQPAVAATATTPVATQHNAATPTRRPGVNGSLPPGSMSANRPAAVDPAQARKEFMRELRDMKPEVMKAKLKNDPQFVSQLRTYGIRIQ